MKWPISNLTFFKSVSDPFSALYIDLDILPLHSKWIWISYKTQIVITVWNEKKKENLVENLNVYD